MGRMKETHTESDGMDDCVYAWLSADPDYAVWLGRMNEINRQMDDIEAKSNEIQSIIKRGL